VFNNRGTATAKVRPVTWCRCRGRVADATVTLLVGLCVFCLSRALVGLSSKGGRLVEGRRRAGLLALSSVVTVVTVLSIGYTVAKRLKVPVEPPAARAPDSSLVPGGQPPGTTGDGAVSAIPTLATITPDGKTLRNQKEIVLSAPVMLQIEVDSPPDSVEYYARDLRGLPPPRGDFRLGAVRENLRFEWQVTPPEHVEVYAIAHFGNVTRRSAGVTFSYPLPARVACPDVAFPSFPKSNHAQVSLVVDRTLGVVTIVTPGGNLDFSTGVNPSTCQDAEVRHWLSQANLKPTP